MTEGASNIYSQVVERMTELGFCPSPNLFSVENLPNTLKNKSFFALLGPAAVDPEGGGFNNKLNLQRDIRISVVIKGNPSKRGADQMDILKEAYDAEESIIISFSKSPVDGINLAILESAMTEPVDPENRRYLIMNIEFRARYTVTT